MRDSRALQAAESTARQVAAYWLARAGMRLVALEKAHGELGITFAHDGLVRGV